MTHFILLDSLPVSGDNPWEKDDLSTVVARRYVAVEESPPTFTVVSLQGPDQGLTWVLDPSDSNTAFIGKSVSCAIRLRDQRVSRRHAALERVGARLRVRDLESANGTRVDGVTVVEAYIEPGALLQVGDTTLRIDKSTAAAAPPAPSPAKSFGKLLGGSIEMRRLYPLAERLARSDVPVVIEGETGTGKEVLAEAIHEASARASGPYVVFDCTTVAASLVESELFGHERGAFTGAVSTRRGVFEQAHGGTLFIDEIGDLPLPLQAKLLRAIERSEVRRVGGEKSLVVNVRIVCATRRDLDREVQEGRFRDDLFHRLAVGRIELPPLRRRKGDIAVLTEHFWKALGGPGAAPTELVSRWEEEPWTGNVRELRNTVARQIALADAPSGPESVEPTQPDEAAVTGLVADILGRELPLPLARMKLVAEFEQLYIARILAQHGGNTAEAARASGVALRYFNLLRSGARRK
ncbi:MAG: sigma 54-dependent Fis family transcriptional regulator [Polyangiaceae bacterium]|nr:sigma 54-dependent Fis family transcriptional regulator [Polyangiaceae bacterium]